VAVASVGPYANLHLAPDTTSTASHQVFYRPDAFLPPNQQYQSTEGNRDMRVNMNKTKVTISGERQKVMQKAL